MFEKFKAQKEKKRAKKKSVVMGAFSALAFIFGLCFIPSLCSLLFALVGVLLLPIPQLQALWERVFPKSKFKGIACGALAVAAFASAPAATSDSASPVVDDTTPPEQIVQSEDETPPVESKLPSTFTIHFLDVGQADAALVECDGRYMLIDGGDSNDSSFIYSYLKDQGADHLDYIVATHAHDDHIGGLSGALNYALVDTVYCSVDNHDSEAFSDFVKYLNKQGKEITVPAVGDTFELGSASVQVIGVDSTSDSENNSSIVLRIVYGDTSFLFTGDIERYAELTIALSNYELKSTVLKVPHHGSDTSTTAILLSEVSPEYAVISVGEGNTNKHPKEDVLNRLDEANVSVYRTDLQGTIICESDGESVTFEVSKTPDADTLAPPAEEEAPVVVAPVTPPVEETPSVTPAPEDDETISNTTADTDYVGNKNTHKFHRSGCDSIKDMDEENKYYYTGTRDEMISMGYKPCKRCNP